MDIYSYLHNDHQKVSNLMEQILATNDKSSRGSLLQQMKELLLLHAKTENATFYKALENNNQTKERIEHAQEEHHEIEEYLTNLGAQESNTDKWFEQFGELKHAVTHHVEEEEGEIFEHAQQVLTNDQAVQLAAEMDALKQKELEQKELA
jgi:hemerythrin superfamily protein